MPSSFEDGKENFDKSNIVYYVHYYFDFFLFDKVTLIHNCVDDWKSSNIIDLIVEVMVYCNASYTLIYVSLNE